MDAVKSTLNKILHPHSSSNDSSTEGATSQLEAPHNDSTAAQEDSSLSEAAKDLSLNDKQSATTASEHSLSRAVGEQQAHSFELRFRRASGDSTTTNALEHRKQNDGVEQSTNTSGTTSGPPPVGAVPSSSTDTGSAAKESTEVSSFALPNPSLRLPR
ncbi:hypothetical protein BCR35DRAFT_185181 [Leucosporidium creatinivorum]|uniref:Uncharacterized protein n=1 Tax=Leucosporidium creatinivorum TaxID=106004 RepID=A0A1Y2DZP6_9BASI|nr:hypothetical protein BCR35DRAFT_185181 [Leucosporidium creatinivorum]